MTIALNKSLADIIWAGKELESKCQKSNKWSLVLNVSIISIQMLLSKRRD